MYIENKSGGLDGDGRTGWVELSRSGHTYFYCGLRLMKTSSGYKYNGIDEETGDVYWVSGLTRTAQTSCMAASCRSMMRE